MDIVTIASGLIVGIIVGATGVGGGALMTPLLIFGFNVPAGTAVGTDLLFASISKSLGVAVHHRKQQIDWRICGQLALGSIPAALATLLAIHFFVQDAEALARGIKATLGVALLLTAIAIVWREWFATHRSFTAQWSPKQRAGATVAVGALVGALVALTSVGAGAVTAVALLMLYPAMAVRNIAGTDIAHAVPLTLVAGLGHTTLGHVDWPLLAHLLIGSLPGIWLGSHLSSRIPDHLLRRLLATLLAFTGLRLVW